MKRQTFLERLKSKDRKKRAIQVEIDEEKWLKVKAKLKRNGHTWHDLVDLSCDDYLDEHQPLSKSSR